jgi:hypothetical protein
VVNFSLPAPVCDLHFIPEPQPVLPECEMLDATSPPGWSDVLTPLGGAERFAQTPNDCVPTNGGSKSGYTFLLDPGFCCYLVQFTDPTGAVMLEQEECFCQKPVQTLNSTWGNIKAIYR